jgi:hypothetical protein
VAGYFHSVASQLRKVAIRLATRRAFVYEAQKRKLDMGMHAGLVNGDRCPSAEEEEAVAMCQNKVSSQYAISAAAKFVGSPAPILKEQRADGLCGIRVASGTSSSAQPLSAASADAPPADVLSAGAVDSYPSSPMHAAWESMLGRVPAADAAKAQVGGVIEGARLCAMAEAMLAAQAATEARIMQRLDHLSAAIEKRQAHAPTPRAAPPARRPSLINPPRRNGSFVAHASSDWTGNQLLGA